MLSLGMLIKINQENLVLRTTTEAENIVLNIFVNCFYGD